MKYLSLVVFLAVAVTAPGFSQSRKEVVYIGTFSVRGSEGIYVYQFDRLKARLKHIQTIKTLESPTFLAIHPSGKYLYSVNRGSVDEMRTSGSVSAYSIDPKTGKLTLLNQRPSYGSGPCHISIDKTGKWTFVSNYADGNLVVLPIFDDGILGSSVDSRKHLGSSTHPERQQRPHVHSAVPSPDNKFVVVCDLGTDLVHSYAFDVEGRVTPASVPSVKVMAGGGPRHFIFHPNGKIGYVTEELTSTVAVLSFDSKSGTLQVIQDNISSLPSGFVGPNTAADLHTDPQGRFLYVSNRGHNSIATFRIGSDGKISFLAAQDTKGKTPRNFLIDSKGQFAFVANQDSDNVVLFRINQKTGKLVFTGNQTKVPSPVCVKMLLLK